ncbi:four-carbon acid sugar kinase family protein [Variovorax defluvii]|uniref:Four-carbon acid sugar kinase family protein n=1 Tax=Variovorax defluvii TaxID=913761 RepID=A0ABP8HLM6_9BURK
MRLAFYGDDFTGSTDALEVLAFAGLDCALFLDVPDEQTLREFGPFDAIGVAGASRAMSPTEMDQQLAPVLAAMSRLPVPLVHYKVCSTFDSSPAIGSIGRVMDLSRAAFGDTAIPIVAATPALGRYCAFGNLFARSATDGRVHRIDRHPIMSVHPVTPMHEADLARHLGAQTAMPVTGFTLPQLGLDRTAMAGEFQRVVDAGSGGAVLLDGTTTEQLTETGRLLDGLAHGRQTPLFCVGGSGLEYALTRWWRETGVLPAASTTHDRFDGVSQVLAVSGSASPLSALQIDAAVDAGFVELPVDAAALVAASEPAAELVRLAEKALRALRAGHSVMLHSARGPNDTRIEAMLSALAGQGMSREQARHEGSRLLGHRFGDLVDALLRAHPLQRLLLSGGDTSSHVTQRLAPQALRVVARLAPGAPLCRAISREPHLAQLEIALKGGQMGQPDYFVKALRGTADARPSLS